MRQAKVNLNVSNVCVCVCVCVYVRGKEGRTANKAVVSSAYTSPPQCAFSQHTHIADKLDFWMFYPTVSLFSSNEWHTDATSRKCSNCDESHLLKWRNFVLKNTKIGKVCMLRRTQLILAATQAYLLCWWPIFWSSPCGFISRNSRKLWVFTQHLMIPTTSSIAIWNSI